VQDDLRDEKREFILGEDWILMGIDLMIINEEETVGYLSPKFVSESRSPFFRMKSN